MYIFEHQDRPGLIHVGMTKDSVHEKRMAFTRLAELHGHPRLYARIKTRKPRRLLRALLISLAPSRVSRYFHRMNPEQATDLLIYLANRKGRIQSIESIWPTLSEEDQTFMRLMNRARKMTRDRKYRKNKGKKGAAMVIEIRKAKIGKKGKKRFVRSA